MTRPTSQPPPTAHGSAPPHPVDRTPRAPGALPPLDEAQDHLELPHESDQSTHTTAPAPDPAMRQAHKDLKEGQVDTDMRATPGLDAEQRKRYVPGAGGQPPSQKAKSARR
ncbi:hypothetical protein [Hydrogenophaga sp. 2FB]|uniref:hypothetical protein n=1 Tax=Hydrogenophaga sp. 2FB TaxID=2502187 RepID=UPI001BB13052|nr:hypothetical protein [Hydrogenophaga sp. 2FB]